MAEAQGQPPLAWDLPEHYVPSKLLGKGAYGEVYLCRDTRSDFDVAVKVVRNFSRDPLFGKRILRELRLLGAMKHENVLSLLDIPMVPSPDFEDVYMVMPFMKLNLHQVIYSKERLTEAHCQAFTCQILRGLKYLHSAEIVHRDLKPENIMVNKDITLRIGDLGLARGRLHEEEDLTQYVVTRWYRSLELLVYPAGYFAAVDMWSVGCIHFECVFRRPLFPGKDGNSMLELIAETLGLSVGDFSWMPPERQAELGELLKRLPETPVASLASRLPDASEECLDLLTHLLEKDPRERISAASALEHPYLVHLRDPHWEKTAKKPFDWNFDSFNPTPRGLKDRIYAECARYHPELLQRDKEWLSKRGFRG